MIDDAPLNSFVINLLEQSFEGSEGIHIVDIVSDNAFVPSLSLLESQKSSSMSLPDRSASPLQEKDEDCAPGSGPETIGFDSPHQASMDEDHPPSFPRRCRPPPSFVAVLCFSPNCQSPSQVASTWNNMPEPPLQQTESQPRLSPRSARWGP